MRLFLSGIVNFFKIKKRQFFIISSLLYVFALYPGKGGVEGQQQYLDSISERTDNWGFFTALLGDWPNFSGHWQFSLSLVQVILFWSGVSMLFFGVIPKILLHKIIYFILLLVSTVFVSQLWRDATLLSIVVFALGLYNIKNRFSQFIKMVLAFISICLLFIGISFKPIYGVVVALVFHWLTYQGNKSYLKKIFRFIGLVISFALLPFIMDKYLTEKYDLIKAFPEQQPIIFDLASNFCWGSPEELVSNAKLGLDLVIKPNYPIQSICSSLRPNRWDNLHSDVNNWQYSSPISRITGASRSDDMHRLQKYWINMIINSPVDWIQVKSHYLGPILIMSNSFIPQKESPYFSTIWGSFNHVIWKLIQFFPILLDKTRITSLSFALLLVFICIFLKGVRSKSNSVKTVLEGSLDEIYAIMVLTTTLIITLIGFVATNGRYILPYIILTYIMLLRNRMNQN